MALSTQRTIVKEFNFKWVGRDRSGKAAQGVMRRPSAHLVRSELLKQSIQPLKIEKVREQRGSGGKIKPKDIMLFSRQMQTMLTAGISISQSLGMQATGTKKLTMRNMLLAVKADVDAGYGFSKALEQHPEIFDELYTGLIGSGERSGTLEEVLENLATYLEKMESIKAKIKKALVYPGVVMSIAGIVTAIILIYVIPVFDELFKSAGTELPAPTQIVVNMSNGVRSWGFIIFILAVVVGVIVIKKMIAKSTALQYKRDQFVLKIPIFGQLIAVSACARFARTLSTMYKAGTPIMDALQTVSGSVGNKIFAQAIDKMRESVAVGQQLNFAMRQSDLFPDMVTHMVGVGEDAGTLSQMLMKVAEFYEEEIDNTVDALMAAMEPLLIVFLGVVIGGLVVSMYLPLFNLGNAVG